MRPSDADVAAYRRAGHLTVAGVFEAHEVEVVIEDIHRWGEEFLRDLPPERRHWYIDGGATGQTVLRKLDNPHARRESVARLARSPRLVGRVESLIGPGVSVYFSQIFFKAPGGGGPKTVHQDNYYFGPQAGYPSTTAPCFTSPGRIIPPAGAERARRITCATTTVS